MGQQTQFDPLVRDVAVSGAFHLAELFPGALDPGTREKVTAYRP